MGGHLCCILEVRFTLHEKIKALSCESITSQCKWGRMFFNWSELERSKREWVSKVRRFVAVVYLESMDYQVYGRIKRVYVEVAHSHQVFRRKKFQHDGILHKQQSKEKQVTSSLSHGKVEESRKNVQWWGESEWLRLCWGQPGNRRCGEGCETWWGGMWR